MLSVVWNWRIFEQISIVTNFPPCARCILKHFFPAHFQTDILVIIDLLMTTARIMERFKFDPFSIFKLQIMISWNCTMTSEVFRCIQICFLVGIEQLAFLQMQITSFRKRQTNYTSAVWRGKERATICEVGHEVMMRICSQFPSSFANNYLALDIHVWVAFIRLTGKCHKA